MRIVVPGALLQLSPPSPGSTRSSVLWRDKSFLLTGQSEARVGGGRRGGEEGWEKTASVGEGRRKP